MEYIIDKPQTSVTEASKDPRFRGIIVRCRRCIYFVQDPDHPQLGVCNRRSKEVVRRTDYCSRAKFDTGRMPDRLY